MSDQPSLAVPLPAPQPTIRQARLAAGLCATCGAEAAPYSTCDKCRFTALLRRICNRMHAHGLVTKEKQGRQNWYELNRQRITEMSSAALAEAVSASHYREAREGDRRLQPRLRRIPIDVEKAVLRLLTEDGLETLTYEEIISAWGKLRLRPGRRSAALDLAMLIRAERKRQAKNVKRASIMEGAHV